MFTYYHGSKNTEVALNKILGSGKIGVEFHMTSDIEVARAYGTPIAITFEKDLTKAYNGMIGGRAHITGLHNPEMNGRHETVLLTEMAVNEFYMNLYDAEVV